LLSLVHDTCHDSSNSVSYYPKNAINQVPYCSDSQFCSIHDKSNSITKKEPNQYAELNATRNAVGILIPSLTNE
jgi:hypothetical protein